VDESVLALWGPEQGILETALVTAAMRRVILGIVDNMKKRKILSPKKKGRAIQQSTFSRRTKFRRKSHCRQARETLKFSRRGIKKRVKFRSYRKLSANETFMGRGMGWP